MASLLRCLRKKSGLTQVQLASELSLPSQKISKVENGMTSLDAAQWVQLCIYFKVSPDIILHSFIDETSVVQRTTYHDACGFSVSKAYLKNTETKTRAYLPFLNFLRERHGGKKTHAFLRSMKVDPDYFSLLDNQLNIKFRFDFLQRLMKFGELNSQKVIEAAALSASPSSHGSLSNNYEKLSTREALIQKIILNLEKYEKDFTTKIEDLNLNARKVVLSTTASQYTKSHYKFKSKEIRELLSLYFPHYFYSFTKYNNKFEAKSSTLKIIDSFTKVEKCTFQMTF